MRRDEPWNRLGTGDYRVQREARAFTGFAIYWLGTNFEGLPLTGVARADNDVFDRPVPRTQPTRAVYDFTFIYGRCTRPGDPPPNAEHGCTLPEIQVSSTALCASGPSIRGGSLGPLRHYGAGALLATQNDVTVVLTGRTVISIQAEDQRQALRVIRAIRRLNAPHRRVPLVPPVQAEITGKPPCRGLSHPAG
jgi:hypothetical protein